MNIKQTLFICSYFDGEGDNYFIFVAPWTDNYEERVNSFMRCYKDYYVDGAIDEKDIYDIYAIREAQGVNNITFKVNLTIK